jgi:hypothetical protein
MQRIFNTMTPSCEGAANIFDCGRKRSATPLSSALDQVSICILATSPLAVEIRLNGSGYHQNGRLEKGRA